jgi:DNA-binding response OmpR family regulator/HPt (histidine-containing phosphotransfer) domain-containing protein
MTASQPPYLLVVEDEATIADVQIEHLRAAGLRVDHLSRGDLVEDHVRAMPPDLIVLDVMLPGMDGTDVCRALRRFTQVPIIMVTSRIDERDRLLGFDMGADDYVCKPFSPKELVARVRAALRRGQGARPGPAATGASSSAGPEELVVLDAAQQRVMCRGQALELTPHEYRLLAVMLAQPGRVFSRASLLEQSYDDPTGVFDRAVDSHVKNLRKKFAALAPGHAFIHSVYGLGYRYEVEAIDAPPAPAPRAAAQAAKVPIELKARLPAFLASRREGIAEMQQALEANRRDDLRRTAHRLAGSFALYGFSAAARSCQRIESTADRGVNEQLQAALARLRQHLATVDIQYVETEDFQLPE